MGDHSFRIHRIELPVPFPVRTTNVYLVDDEPITLIDTGVKSDRSLRGLEDSLRRLGYGVEDIGRILITHGHIDHYGQAKHISARSGAEIYIHEKEHQRIHSIGEFRRNLVSVLMENGIPKDLLDEAINYMKSAIQSLSEPLDDVRSLNEGDEIGFENMTLQPILCPGHSPGLICFYLEEGGILISGDHLLSEISPNPIIDLSPEGSGPRSTSLKAYLNSLMKIKDLEVSLVLPGHGEPVRDFKGTVDRAFFHHEQRLSMVLSVLSLGEKTVYEISHALFPNAKSFEVFLGMSEVLGHLRILLDEGKISFRSREGMDYYSRT